MKLVVCDFGLVEKVPENGTVKGKSGTASTWAPEVARGEKFNCSADWWSIGIVIY
jgi:serine/threonine protein kinase